MKQKIFCLSLLFALLFSATAYADANEGGFDIRIGLAANLLRLKADSDANAFGFSGSTDGEFLNYDGPMGKLSLGYRWAYGGIYIDQDLGGVISREEEDENTAYFLGGTFIIGRAILPLSPRFQIDLGAGIGLLYGHGEKTSDPDYGFDPDGFQTSIITDKNGDPSVAFAIKASLALTYYFSPAFGMGIYCDYNYAYKKISYENDYLSLDITRHYHVINPGIQAMIRF